jgi:N-carbamoylputrescine amidase
MGSGEIKVGAVQMRTMPAAKKDERIEHVLSLVERAAKEDCKIILLGELCTIDYDQFFTLDPSNYEWAESIPGPTTQAVGRLTKACRNYVILPIFEKKMAGVYYNSAAVVGPEGSVVGIYRKTHLASAKVLERLYFRSGQTFQVWQTDFPPFVRFGVIICFDRRHPEPSRILAMMGAEIMFCPAAASDYAGGKIQWDLVNASRSADTGMFTVYANRAGKELDYSYFGQSMIVNPFGEVIAKAGAEGDVIVSALLNLAEVDRARTSIPLLREARNDLYAQHYRHPICDELL